MTRKDDQERTLAQELNVDELRHEVDRLRRRVAELEGMTSEAEQAKKAQARQEALMQAMLRNLPFDFWARDLNENIIRDIVAPIRKGDEIPGILGTNIDITEHAQSIRALHKSEAHLASLLNSLDESSALLNMTQRLSRIGGWQWDVTQGVMTWTKELYRLHGFSLDQFEPGSPEHIRSSQACYDPEDRELLRRSFENCATLGLAYDLELGFTPVGKDRIRIRTSAEAVWENGRVSKVLGTFQDVTEKRALEQRYETLFQNMLEGFALHEIICDPSGRPVDYRFLEVNPAFERHTGLAGQDIKDGNPLSGKIINRHGHKTIYTRAHS